MRNILTVLLLGVFSASPVMAGKTDKKAVMEKALEDLRKQKIEERAPKVGQQLPDFQLPLADGGVARLSELRKKGPVVVSFYRGSWCPYCMAQLSEYQKRLKELDGATLVAISPEEPALTKKMAAEKGFTFPLAFDKNNTYAEKLKIVFGLPEDLKAVYRDFGIDLQKSQGNDRWRLPVPATYVVDREGVIRYAFMDVDYKKRADIAEIAAAVKSAKK